MRALVLMCFVACTYTPEDVVVAQLDGGRGGRGFRTCVGNQDCMADELCERASCTDVTGQCAPRAVICDGTSAPSCGCDGLTYWNDCLRRASGITAATSGSCDTSAITCDRSQSCPLGAFCARLYPQGACDANGNGSCWVLPAACPDAGSSPMWTGCPTTSVCTDACDAIRSEATFTAVDSCN